MEKDKTMNWIRTILAGLLIGAANAVPGISGGTIAVITGVYEDIIQSITEFRSSGWQKNLRFLSVLVIALLTGLMLIAKVIELIYEQAPEIANLAIIGLILGSLPYLIKISKIKQAKPLYFILIVLAFIPVAFMSGAPRPEETEPILQLTWQSGILIYLTGVISAATMIIPGVSGSFVLLLIGMYSTFTNAFDQLLFPILIVYLLGAVSGIVLMVKILKVLFQRYHEIVYSIIIGFVLGSLIALFPPLKADLTAVFAVLSCLAAGAAAFFLSKR
jgi:putative membrane protein